MKQFYLKTLVLLMMSMVGSSAMAYDCKVNGIYYNLNQEKMTAEVAYGTSMLNSYSGDIVIPSTITYSGNFYSVTSIGYYAFSYCNGPDGLTSVIIPNSVTSIGDGAFIHCNGLTSITIPNSVTSIGNSAFGDCSGLASVTIPNSVTSIGENAFSKCEGLTSVTIPNSVTSIGSGAYCGCSGLTSITVKSGNTKYDSRNNCNAIIETATNTLISGCKNTVIPNSVTRIGDYAFRYFEDLTSITIPDSVTSIGGYAFAGCSSLTSITIPDSVTSIGYRAFSSCSGLTSITIGNSVTSIGKEAFSGCSGINVVSIPSSVTSIGKEAFSGWSLLISVNISDIEKWSQIKFGDSSANPLYYAKHLYLNGEEVTKLNLTNDVSNYAFINCLTLTEVDVKGVGTDAFAGCPNITSVKVDCETVENWFADSKAKVQTLTLGECVTTINENSFDGFSALKTVYLGSNVSTIGAKAFANCGKLDDVYCYAVRYPVVERNTFENSYLDYVTLHVPAESLNNYKNHEVWGRFKAVVPLNEEVVGISTIRNAERIMHNGIYDLNGRKVSAEANSSLFTIHSSLKKGLNIIRMSDGTVKKVMVK